MFFHKAVVSVRVCVCGGVVTMSTWLFLVPYYKRVFDIIRVYPSEDKRTIDFTWIKNAVHPSTGLLNSISHVVEL